MLLSLCVVVQCRLLVGVVVCWLLLGGGCCLLVRAYNLLVLSIAKVCYGWQRRCCLLLVVLCVLVLLVGLLVVC